MTARTLLILACLLVAARPATAQQDILPPEADTRTFLATLSGTVGNASFNGVRAQVIITHGADELVNPLRITITGFPVLGERNSLFWDSDKTGMDTLGSRVRCRLKAGAHQGTDLHFYYMSPALYGNRGTATIEELERLRRIDTHAKPLRVAALEGDLDLSVQGNRLTGTVWMTGIDPMGHEPVRYRASLTGVATVHERPRP